jgi:hypothetical protein
MSDGELAGDDFASMDDPEFLAEWRRLHDALDDSPSGNPEDYCRLRERYRLVEAEFLRRAGMKWQQVS